MINPDILIPSATASFYAFVNSNIVKENFSDIFQMLVSSFHDDAFIERLQKLRPRGIVTRSIMLPEQDEEQCLVEKLWFKVKKTASPSLERYFVSIGLTFRLSEYNYIPYKKIWVSYVAAGPIDFIQFLLAAPSCEKIVCEKLSEYVYDTCYNSLQSVFAAPIGEESPTPSTSDCIIDDIE